MPIQDDGKEPMHDLNPFLARQGPFGNFNTIADAIAGLKFKQPGDEVYIISEDEYYYWKNDTEGFLKQEIIMNSGGAPSGLASGDLGGNYPSPSVNKIKGTTVDNGAIQTDKSLVYNGTDLQYKFTDIVNISASRNISATTNVYLRGEDGVPMNQAPYILPFDATLIFISSSTNAVENWSAEIHVNQVLIGGAVLTSVGVDNNRAAYNINFNVGDKVMLYCNGTTINRPRINAIFKRR